MTPAIKTPVDVLRAARKLIEKEENWTQKCSARDVLGKGVLIDDERAVCFCLSGAISRACHFVNHAYVEARNLVRSELPRGYGNIEAYNDTHSHAEVLALFDKAITLAERDRAL